jgi:hypothetical protein
MKFIVSILLTAFLGYVAPLYLPWWGFAFTSFIVALAIHQKPLQAFIAGFIALFLFWGIYAFVLDYNNQHLLSQKVAQILPVGSGIALIIITSFIGGLASGFAALTGSYARMVNKEKGKLTVNH